MESERPLTEAERAYAAGFFDGEGFIGIYKRSAPAKGKTYSYYTLLVGASQCDPRPLLFIQDRFGGSLGCDRSGKKSSGNLLYTWQVGARKAESFLRAIQPYLIHKAEQCAVAIAYRDIVNGRRKGNHLAADAEFQALIRSVRAKTRTLA